jgi:V/A-type H+-transporting ATPase subunit A
LTLEVARFLREAWLQQNAFIEVDQYCPPEKTYRILQAIKHFHDEAFDALEANVPVEEIQNIESLPDLNRIATTEDDEVDAFVDDLEERLATELREKY